MIFWDYIAVLFIFYCVLPGFTFESPTLPTSLTPPLTPEADLKHRCWYAPEDTRVRHQRIVGEGKLVFQGKPECGSRLPVVAVKINPEPHLGLPQRGIHLKSINLENICLKFKKKISPFLFITWWRGMFYIMLGACEAEARIFLPSQQMIHVPCLSVWLFNVCLFTAVTFTYITTTLQSSQIS